MVSDVAALATRSMPQLNDLPLRLRGGAGEGFRIDAEKIMVESRKYLWTTNGIAAVSDELTSVVNAKMIAVSLAEWMGTRVPPLRVAMRDVQPHPVLQGEHLLAHRVLSDVAGGVLRMTLDDSVLTAHSASPDHFARTFREVMVLHEFACDGDAEALWVSRIDATSLHMVHQCSELPFEWALAALRGEFSA